jgi:hypothetical protein
VSGPKRTPRSRQRKEPITPEMVELYKRGRELQAQGHDKARPEWGDDDHPYWQFRDIRKRLDWTLLDRVGQCSVFDDFGDEEPDYMARRSDPAHPDFCGWHSGRRLQQALEAALAAQDKGAR